MLQGDTLAPFVFILVLDSILRGLPRDAGIVVDNAVFHEGTSHRPRSDNRFRLHWLAYADDVILLAHNQSDLQRLFSALERRAAAVGLLVNLGKNKTECFGIACPHPTITTMKNQVVTINTNYCYLGSHVADATFDLKRRISKAWAAAKSFQDIGNCQW